MSWLLWVGTALGYMLGGFVALGVFVWWENRDIERTLSPKECWKRVNEPSLVAMLACVWPLIAVLFLLAGVGYVPFKITLRAVSWLTMRKNLPRETKERMLGTK